MFAAKQWIPYLQVMMMFENLEMETSGICTGF
jgi:hypothetical protein